jgi:N utilization substance protein B
MDMVNEAFDPGWNVPDEDEKAENEKNKSETILLLQSRYQGIKTFSEPENVSGRSREVYSQAWNHYQSLVKKDFSFLRGNMLSGAEKIFYLYLLTLELIIGLSEVLLIEKEEKERKSLETKIQTKYSPNFSNNRLIRILKNDIRLKDLLLKNKLNWKDHQLELRRWLKDNIKTDDLFKTYQELDQPGFKEDKEIILHLTRNLFFKEKNINDFWEEKDQNWTENHDIVKSMVLKTIKSLDENVENEVEIAELSYNWEDDKNFFYLLYDYTIEKEQEFEAIIARKVQNWEIDRVALVDKLILMMAITEMTSCPSIPVKVTINEYIEISKNYSTPKSKQFVNGILDVLAEELTRDGLIRKSGRGLIDNK